jgi:hypothetical protein
MSASSSPCPPPFPIIGLAAGAAAAAGGVPVAALASPRRLRAPIARARQLAVYLHHVALGATLSDCARHFGRDRATVRHACAHIEDMRDEPRFDCAAGRLEAALVAQRNMILALVAAMTGEAR